MDVLSRLLRLRNSRSSAHGNLEEVPADLDRLTHEAAEQRQSAARASQQLTDQHRTIVRHAHGHVVRMERGLRNLDARVASLKRAVTIQADRMNDFLVRLEDSASSEGVEKRVIKRLMRLADVDGPVLVGPWMRDRGGELLYWIPFVRWVAQRFQVRPDRLHVIAREGGSCWYEDFAAHSIDLLSCCSPDELRSSHSAQGAFWGFDRRVLRRVKQRFHETPVSILHPVLIDRLFGCRTNSEDVPLERVLTYTVPRRPEVPSAKGLALPSSYVAAWFPFSDAFPDTESNRVQVGGILASLARHTDVVLLNGDHADASHAAVAAANRIHAIERELPAGTRADALTAVIGRASACVGSPSGLAYIASLCGVKSLTVYSDRRHWRYRAELVDSLRNRIGAAGITSLDIEYLPLLSAIAPPSLAGS